MAYLRFLNIVLHCLLKYCRYCNRAASSPFGGPVSPNGENPSPCTQGGACIVGATMLRMAAVTTMAVGTTTLKSLSACVSLYGSKRYQNWLPTGPLHQFLKRFRAEIGFPQVASQRLCKFYLWLLIIPPWNAVGGLDFFRDHVISQSAAVR